MTSIKDLVGQEYGNGSTEEKVVEPHTTNNIGNGKDKGKKKRNDNQNVEVQPIEKGKRKHITYKYSNKGKGILHEATIVAGQPVLLGYENGKLETVEQIAEPNRILKPPSHEAYPYEPYEFGNMEEVLRYTDRALNESIDSLYSQARQIASDYNDQKKEKIDLLAIEIISSYFQDRFPTIHYDIVLGGNGSGKSSYGDTFAAVGYRVVKLTNPNAANINRILGCIEIGQCTIVSDETGPIDKQPDLLSLLKTGYSPTGKTSKINDFSRIPEFFYTYCFKMIISERMPNLRDARGVVDRSFSFTTYKGLSKYDIKETLEPQGNKARQQRLNALNDFRKLMLIYRLIHFKDEIPDIDIGVEGREKELSKPIIQLFYNTNLQREIEATLQYFLNLRTEKKEITLEPILHPIVTRLVSENGTEITFAVIWEAFRNEIQGYYDDKKPHEYQTLEYGTVYTATISNILEHTFGGRPKHRRFGNTYIFYPEELARVGKAYNLSTKIQTKIITNVTEENHVIPCEDREACEGIREGSLHFNDNEMVQNNVNSQRNEVQNNDTIGLLEDNGPPIGASHPSHPSHEDTENSSTVARSIYRLGHSDIWACKNCRLTGDIHFMKNHICRGSNTKK